MHSSADHIKYRIGFIDTISELKSQFHITVVAGNSGRQRGKKLKVQSNLTLRNC